MRKEEQEKMEEWRRLEEDNEELRNKKEQEMTREMEKLDIKIEEVFFVEDMRDLKIQEK